MISSFGYARLRWLFYSGLDKLVHCVGRYFLEYWAFDRVVSNMISLIKAIAFYVLEVTLG